MEFNEWLHIFSRSKDPYDPSYNYTLLEALEKRYKSIRFLPPGSVYDYITDKHIKLSSQKDILRDFLKIQNLGLTDYGKVYLLNKDDYVDNYSSAIAYWYYRENKEAIHKVKERLSLNVYPSADLLLKIEDIINKDNKNNICQYKFPNTAYNWSKRFDPITIYFNSLNKELLEKIVSSASPYLREEKATEIVTTKNPYEVKLPSGIYYNKEHSEEDTQYLLDKIKKYFPYFVEEIKGKYSGYLSIGKYCVLKLFMNQFIKDIGKISKESIFKYIEFNKKKAFDKAIENMKNLYNQELNENKEKLEDFYTKNFKTR